VPHYRAYTLCGGACADAIGFHTLYEDPENREKNSWLSNK